MCTESPEGDAYIGLSQPQSKLTVPAERVKVCLPYTVDAMGLVVEEVLFKKCDLHDQKKLTS